MKTIYIISSKGNAHKVRDLLDIAKALGYTPECDWTKMLSTNRANITRLEEIAALEINAVTNADLVCFLPDGGHGSHVEIGARLASGRKVHCILPMTSEERDKCIFYFHTHFAIPYQSSQDTMIQRFIGILQAEKK